MAKTLINGLTRRTFFGVGLGAAAGVALASNVRAQAQLEKDAVNYQEEPQGEQRCSNCVFWLPGEDPEGVGACSMVQGEILPEAWCAIWAPQS